jgi:hypothetical protein
VSVDSRAGHGSGAVRPGLCLALRGWAPDSRTAGAKAAGRWRLGASGVEHGLCSLGRDWVRMPPAGKERSRGRRRRAWPVVAGPPGGLGPVGVGRGRLRESQRPDLGVSAGDWAGWGQPGRRLCFLS